LQVRETRRKLIIYVIVALLVMFALGNWPLSGWLEDSPVRFLFYWLGCAFVALFLFLLGLYDFLAVIREHKDRMRM
jgi:bacteriorhodopsin